MDSKEKLPDNRHIVTLTVFELNEAIFDSFKNKILQLPEFQNIKKPESDPLPELIPRKNLAKRFGISTVSLDKWKRAGILPPPVKMAGKVYYVASEIIELLKNRKSR